MGVKVENLVIVPKKGEDKGYLYRCAKCNEFQDREPAIITLGGMEYYFCILCKFEHGKKLADILDRYDIKDMGNC